MTELAHWFVTLPDYQKAILIGLTLWAVSQIGNSSVVINNVSDKK